jgi:hypothetical protein
VAPLRDSKCTGTLGGAKPGTQTLGWAGVQECPPIALRWSCRAHHRDPAPFLGFRCGRLAGGENGLPQLPSPAVAEGVVIRPERDADHPVIAEVVARGIRRTSRRGRIVRRPHSGVGTVHSEAGVVVEEHFPDTPVSRYYASQQSFMAENNSPELQGSFKLVDVATPGPALLSIPPSGSPVMITWLNRGRELIVRGPTLTEPQAVAIARDF